MNEGLALKRFACRPHTGVATGNLRIECLVLTSKGFICSATNGALYVFEKTDDPTAFQEIRSVSITDDSSSLETMGSGEPPSPDHTMRDLM